MCRANHAGSGDDDVLKAVIGEKPLPAPNEANTDGNSRFYGFECENLGDGKDPWPAVQVEAMVRAAAAICRAHGWGKDGDTSVIGHREVAAGQGRPARSWGVHARHPQACRRTAQAPGVLVARHHDARSEAEDHRGAADRSGEARHRTGEGLNIMKDSTKRTLRTVLQTALSIAVVLPGVVAASGVPEALPWVAGALAVAGGFARVMALPGVQLLLPGWLRTDDGGRE